MFDPGDGKIRLAGECRAARILRRDGWSHKRIASELQVSASSVHRWTRDIQLSESQVASNLGRGLTRTGAVVNPRAAARSEKNRQRRLLFQKQGRLRARGNDPTHRGGCMLYWAEGAKDKNEVRFANSDPFMVRQFADFLRTTFNITDEDFKLRLNVYLGNGLVLDAIEEHWLRATTLPRTCFRGHQINHYPTSSSGKKRSLPFGVCDLRVARSTWIAQHIFGAIQEYAGFDEPRWLG